MFARYKRMTGHNVLHAMGYDAFGLPAEQYAVQTGQHPRITTEANIATCAASCAPRAGPRPAPERGDHRPGVLPLDPVDLPADLRRLVRPRRRPGPPDRRARGRAGRGPASRPRAPTRRAGLGRADPVERRRSSTPTAWPTWHEAPVNWCPGLGTVLANEEVTADGRSERGNFPVFRRPLKQWMMRITAYADRLIADLDRLDWPESIKIMQRNWIGRSRAREVRFPTPGRSPIEVFTTRPDTLFGATYMVLAPEHPLVDELDRSAWPEGTDARWTGGRRHAEGGGRRPTAAPPPARASSTGRPSATRPACSPAPSPPTRSTASRSRVRRRLRADGLRHRRDHGRARPGPARLGLRRGLRLPIVRTVQPPEGWDGQAYVGEGPAINSATVPRRARASPRPSAPIIAWLEEHGAGEGTVTYKLRDWLFSRQRYWGEPFPIVFDEHDLPLGGARVELPVLLPEIDDYSPRTSTDDTTRARAAAGPADDWVEVELDLGDGPKTSTAASRTRCRSGPARAGTSLRYLDPTNENAFVDPEVERYWMGPQSRDPAASTCTSAASSTPCCTCSTRASGTRSCTTSAT